MFDLKELELMTKNLNKLDEHNYSLTKEDYDNFIRNNNRT